jgi:hypothetical protein
MYGSACLFKSIDRLFFGARTGGNKIAKMALEGPWHFPCRGRAAQKSITVFSRGHNCLSHGTHANRVASI